MDKEYHDKYIVENKAISQHDWTPLYYAEDVERERAAFLEELRKEAQAGAKAMNRAEAALAASQLATNKLVAAESKLAAAEKENARLNALRVTIDVEKESIVKQRDEVEKKLAENVAKKEKEDTELRATFKRLDTKFGIIESNVNAMVEEKEKAEARVRELEAAVVEKNWQISELKKELRKT